MTTNNSFGTNVLRQFRNSDNFVQSVKQKLRYEKLLFAIVESTFFVANMEQAGLTISSSSDIPTSIGCAQSLVD